MDKDRLDFLSLRRTVVRWLESEGLMNIYEIATLCSVGAFQVEAALRSLPWPSLAVEANEGEPTAYTWPIDILYRPLSASDPEAALVDMGLVLAELLSAGALDAVGRTTEQIACRAALPVFVVRLTVRWLEKQGWVVAERRNRKIYWRWTVAAPERASAKLEVAA